MHCCNGGQRDNFADNLPAPTFLLGFGVQGTTLSEQVWRLVLMFSLPMKTI